MGTGDRRCAPACPLKISVCLSYLGGHRFVHGAMRALISRSHLPQFTCETEGTTNCGKCNTFGEQSQCQRFSNLETRGMSGKYFREVNLVVRLQQFLAVRYYCKKWKLENISWGQTSLRNIFKKCNVFL